MKSLFKKVFIIAEAGVNHNGRLDLAYGLVDAAKRTGADAVKFQAFKAEELVSPNAPLAAYQKQTLQGSIKNQFDLIKSLELSMEDFRKIQTYCRKKNILFLVTPFDHQSVDLLQALNVAMFKIPSGEITNVPFLKYVAQKQKPILLSTGMSTLEEVKEAVKAIYQTRNRQLVLLHCVSEYPAPMEDLNLRAITTLQKRFGLDIGFSDHSLGIEASVAAVALGAKVIEKHMTLDKTMPGPDHKASLDTKEFAQLVKAIRHIEKAMGDGVKSPQKSEIKNIATIRKSIYARNKILQGQIIKDEDLVIRRPAQGLLPKEIEGVIGRRAKRDIKENALIKREYF